MGYTGCLWVRNRVPFYLSNRNDPRTPSRWPTRPPPDDCHLSAGQTRIWLLNPQKVPEYFTPQPRTWPGCSTTMAYHAPSESHPSSCLCYRRRRTLRGISTKIFDLTGKVYFCFYHNRLLDIHAWFLCNIFFLLFSLFSLQIVWCAGWLLLPRIHCGWRNSLAKSHIMSLS